MTAQPARIVPPVSERGGLSRDIVPLGYMVVELAAFLDGLDSRSAANLADVGTLREAGERISRAVAEVGSGMTDLSETARATASAASGRLDAIAINAARFRRLSEWGTGIAERTRELERVLGEIVSANAEIARIARQVNILAVNASIEAARAGDAGRGFAIVAEAINELSRKTASAAGDVSGSIGSLDDWTRTMREDAERYAPEFEAGIDGARETSRVVGVIADEMARAGERIEAVAASMRRLGEDDAEARPIYDAIAAASAEVAGEVHTARGRSDAMMDACETLIQRAVEAEADGPDHRFVRYVTERADRAGRRMAEGVRRGLISARDLFRYEYEAIDGADPPQHDAPFARFTDALVQDILEEALDYDPAVVFCAICDRNGYIPTHNLKFSHPPGPDPAWNAAHCRNRRFFSDRVGTKAGANTAPFLLQVYRRDMGAEGFVMMKDLSAPVVVGGRHWGGLRMGYRRRL